MKITAPSIRIVFIAAISLLTLLITVSLTFFISKQYKQDAMEHLNHYTEMMAQNLALSVTDYIITENFSPLQDFVLVYCDRPYIEAIAITNASGRILAASHAEDLGEFIAQAQTAKEDTAFSSFNFTTWIMQYALPIRLAGASIGWCHITVDTKYINQTLLNLQQRVVIFGFLSWMLACLASIILSSFLSRSIQNLLHISKEISFGNFKTKADIRGLRESRQLGTAINTMIMALKSREKSLLLSENKYRTLVENINDWVWEVDVNGIFTYVSPAVEKILGYRPEEMLGKTPFELMDKNESQRVGKKFFGFVDKKQAFTHLVNAMIHKNATKVTLEASGQPILDNIGNVQGYRGVARDISEQEQVKQALQEEKERLSVTLRSIGDGVITTDTEGKIVFLNRVAEKLCGWSHQEAKGLPSTKVFNIINEKTNEKCSSPVQRVMELGRIIGLANHTALIARDGTVHSIADSGAPIRDQQSRIIGVVLVFRDVTHERKIEEELLKVKKLESVGVLAGGIAHDFNNILSAILGNIELADYRIKNDSHTSSLLSQAEKATKRAAQLTNQLLTFSKGGAPVKEETSLPGLIADSADFVLHGSKVACVYSCPDSLWLVDADSGQIGQVIQNIIINAKHAMPKGGTVNIQCSNIQDAATEALLSVDRGDYVRISIEDTGVGIPREIIDKIFDPYFSTKHTGSGLGLAICHSIVNKHGGYLMVSSEPGKGSIFTLYLPAIPAATAQSTELQQIIPATKAARIMVMDDDEMLREIALSQLAALGHETLAANDGEQAVNIYQEFQDKGQLIDLVIMDLTIPGGMGGQEAAEKLLRLDPEAKLIVASGYSNDPVMAAYSKYGFQAALAKPFDLKELNSALVSVLG